MSDNHAFHQTDLPKDLQVLNISVNMGRISNWIVSLDQLFRDKGVEVYQSRVNLISKMIVQTESYLKDLESQNISDGFKNTLSRFKEDFNKINMQTITKDNQLYWAEKALTWANILQHRAKLA